MQKKGERDAAWLQGIQVWLQLQTGPAHQNPSTMFVFSTFEKQTFNTRRQLTTSKLKSDYTQTHSKVRWKVAVIASS